MSRNRKEGKTEKIVCGIFWGGSFLPIGGEKTVKQLEVRKNERNKNCIKKEEKKHF